MRSIVELSIHSPDVQQASFPHIVQSARWGQFLEKQGKHVFFLGEYEDDELLQVYLLYITSTGIGGLRLRIGVMTQSCVPDEVCVAYLKMLGKREHLLFIKCEPRVENTPEQHARLASLGFVKGRDLFLKSSFILNLKDYASPEDLFPHFSTMNRRNIRTAQKKGVVIERHAYEKGNRRDIDIFYEIQVQTTREKHFATHPRVYFYQEYEILQDSMYIFHARYQEEIISSLVLFLYNGTCYYPYGGTLRTAPEARAMNLLMYEAICFAYEQGCTAFDFWGALGPQVSLPHPLEGVHNFKKGYGGKLYDFVGAYDLVFHPLIYTLFYRLYDFYWKMR